MTHPGGAPSKYNGDDTVKLAGWFARDGVTFDEIAKRLGVSRSTFQLWIKKYPELSDAIKTSKESARYTVEDSLFKRANGYNYEKTEIEVQMLGGKEVKKKKVTTMHVPGDPACMIFYLKTQWKDKYGETPIEFDKAKGEITDLFNQWKGADAGTRTT
jgi:hypothetical protein